MRTTNTRRIRRRGGAAAALAVVALQAPPALASTATISSTNRLSVNAEGAELNNVLIQYDRGADVYTVHDSAGITPSGPCAAANPLAVTCPGAGVVAITVKAGAGADFVFLEATIPATIEGSLDGGGGGDELFGGVAADSLIGGPDDDLLHGAEGADELRGSGGRDTVTYSDRTTSVAVTVGAGDGNDGNAIDQTAAALDTVRGDIEEVIGGAGGDSITGDRGDEVLLGLDGDDVIAGGGGADTIIGFGGADFLLGDGGRDVLRGELGGDRLHGGDDGDRAVGGPDDDVVKGQRGIDVMKGNGGIDRILAKDGNRDTKISCGPGPNRLEKAKRDRGKRRKGNNDPKPKSC